MGWELKDPLEETKRDLLTSANWTRVLQDFSILSVAVAGTLDMKEWDEATHKAVRAWAKYGGVIPLVLSDYLERIGRINDSTTT